MNGRIACARASVGFFVMAAMSYGCEFDDPEPSTTAKAKMSSEIGGSSGRPPRSQRNSTQQPVSAPHNSAFVLVAARVDNVATTMDASTDQTLPIVPVEMGEGPRTGCPPHMLEVEGKYCEDVVHRCIKGGKSHTGEDDEQPEPFYCDAYQPGLAKCFGKEEPKHFCIDEFEYPNQLGAIPMVMVSWFDAQRLCSFQGKRLCGDDEWTLACEGPERLPYTYGWARDKTACNIDHLWIAPNDGLLANKGAPAADIQVEVDRLSKRVPSGSMPRCKSPYGVMDMNGNVDEWAVNVTLDGKPYRSVFKGGHWVSGARNRCRPVTTSHDENTAYYAEGFRCCADVPRIAEK